MHRILFILSLTSITTPALATNLSPLDPATSWANSFLMNSLFIAEHQSHMKYSKLQKFAEDKTFASYEAKNLFIRSKFAILSSQSKKQAIQNINDAKALNIEHALYLSSHTDTKHSANALLTTKNIDKNFYKKVGSTFSDQKFKESWSFFSQSYVNSDHGCDITPELKEAFSQYQGKLANENIAANTTKILQPIKKWRLAKVRCLLVTLMSSANSTHVSKAIDPVHILNAIAQINSPFAQDTTIKALHAIRFFQLNNYAEALRVLVEMQDKEKAYRLAYEIVQRIYSRSEKGEGKVALKGI